MTTNSNMKGFKFLISVKIQKIKLNISFPCDIIVLWKRGTQRIETKGKVSHNAKISLESTFNEELSMFAHFMFDESLNIFKEKKTSFSLLILTPKGKKIAGTTTINIADYINKKISEIDEEFLLEKCPDKTGKIKIILKIQLIGESDEKELMNQSTISSRMSDPNSLIDESFRTLCNDITFSMDSANSFSKNEKILKDNSNTLNSNYKNAALFKENNNDAIANSLINSYENFKSLNNTASEILFLKKKITEKNDELEKILKNNEELKKINKQKIKEIEDENKDLKKKNIEITNEKEKILIKNNELEQKINKINKEFNDFIENNNSKKENGNQENNELKQRNRKLEDLVVSLGNEKNNLEKKLYINEEEKKSFSIELNNYKNKLQENNNLSEKIQYYETTYKDHLKKMEKNQKEIEFAIQEKEKINNEKENLILEINKLKKENFILKNNSSQKDFTNLQEEIFLLKKEMKNNQFKIEEMDKIIIKYEKELEKTKKKLEKKNKKIENMSNNSILKLMDSGVFSENEYEIQENIEINELKTKIKKKKVKILNMKNKIIEYEKENKNLRTSILNNNDNYLKEINMKLNLFMKNLNDQNSFFKEIKNKNLNDNKEILLEIKQNIQMIKSSIKTD